MRPHVAGAQELDAPYGALLAELDIPGTIADPVNIAYGVIARDSCRSSVRIS